LKFTEQCGVYDRLNKGFITKKDLIGAFTYARIPFTPTDAEWNKLINALEAWDSREDQTVQYRRFLDSTFSRAVVSTHGIFPKLQKREPSKYEQEKKARAEEEEKKEKERLEEERKVLENVKAKKAAQQRASSYAKASDKLDPK
jgi:hypothetical protein